MAQLLANPALAGVALQAAPIVADIGQNVAGGVGGAIGGIFGKKGARVGRKIGRGIVGIGRKIFGFEGGGKVRIQPVKINNSGPPVLAYAQGGRVKGGKRKRGNKK